MTGEPGEQAGAESRGLHSGGACMAPVTHQPESWLVPSASRAEFAACPPCCSFLEIMKQFKAQT